MHVPLLIRDTTHWRNTRYVTHCYVPWLMRDMTQTGPFRMAFRTTLSHLVMRADDTRLRLSNVCDMTQSYMWHDSIIHVTWCTTLSHLVMRADDTWLHVSNVRDMTQSYMWHDSIMCVWHDSFAPHYHILLCALMTPNFTSLMCDNHHSYVWHDLLMCVTWPTRYARWWHPTSLREWVWHDSIIHVTWLNHECVTWLNRTCTVT